MAPVHRRVTHKLYPSPAQAAEMERVCGLHRVLYNAALQERIDAWRLARKSVGYAEQCRSLTTVRRENPEYLVVNAQSLQVTLKRLDLAFAAFFRRVKAGETAGFPRFKGKKRDRARFRIPQRVKLVDGRVVIPKVGKVKVRQTREVPEPTKSATFRRDPDGKWYVSLVVEFETAALL